MPQGPADAITTAPVKPLLTPAQWREISASCSIIAATCGPDREPHLMRALGCRFDDDGLECTILLGRAQCQAMIDDVRAGSRVAVVFARPSNNRSVQIKADAATIEPARPDDARVLADYLVEMTEELGRIGYPAAFVAAMLRCPPDGTVAMRLRPTVAFHQTPGARAGDLLTTTP